MKKIILPALVIAVLGAALFAFAAYNANSLIEKFRPQLENTASKALKSEVKLGKLEVSVFPTAKIHVADLRVGGASGFSLKDLLFDIKLLPLLSKKISATRLTINNPSVELVKGKNGISIAGLPNKRGAKKAGSGADGTEAAQREKSQGPAQGANPVDIELRSIKISDAVVHLREEKSGKSIKLAGFDLNGAIKASESGFELSSLNVNGNLLDSGSLTANGSISGIGGKKINLDLSGELKKLPLSGVASLLATAKGVSVPVKLGGRAVCKFTVKGSTKAPKVHAKIDLTHSELVKEGVFSKAPGEALVIGVDVDGSKIDTSISLSSLVLTKLKNRLSDISLNAATTLGKEKMTFEAKDASLKIGGFPVKFGAHGEKLKEAFNISKLDLTAFGGRLSSKLGYGPAGGGFKVNASGGGVNIASLLKALKPGAGEPIKGMISKIAINLNGSTGGNLTASLKGPISLTVTDGEIKGINIAASVLKLVKGLPFLEGSLFSLAGGYEDATISGDSTQIKELSGDLFAGGGSMKTKNLKLVSQLFRIDGKGKIGFDAAVDLDTTILFNKGFSAYLAGRSSKIKRILNSRGQLELPLSIKGKFPKLILLPNLNRILRLAGEKVIKEKATDLLNRALGGGKSGKSGGIKKGLGDLFGF